MSFSPSLAFIAPQARCSARSRVIYLNDRAKRGKEDPARLGERFGRYTQARPAGALVWIHAASVGESGVALALIEALTARDASLSFLITTGTRTSAELIARRMPRANDARLRAARPRRLRAAVLGSLAPGCRRLRRKRTLAEPHPRVRSARREAGAGQRPHEPERRSAAGRNGAPPAGVLVGAFRLRLARRRAHRRTH